MHRTLRRSALTDALTLLKGKLLTLAGALSGSVSGAPERLVEPTGCLRGVDEVPFEKKFCKKYSFGESSLNLSFLLLDNIPHIGVYEWDDYPKADISIVIHMDDSMLQGIPCKLTEAIKRNLGISGHGVLTAEQLTAKNIKCSFFTAIYVWDKCLPKEFHVLYHGFVGADYHLDDPSSRVKAFNENIPMGMFSPIGASCFESGSTKYMPIDMIDTQTVYFHDVYSPFNAAEIVISKEASIANFWLVALTPLVEKRDGLKHAKTGLTQRSQIVD
jgi:hypothetical protein